MRKKSRWTGFTLPEVIVGVLIIGIFILIATGFFIPLATGLVMSRTRTIITHLAQEKLDYFKAIPYHRILLTKQSDIDLYGYDNTYYPPERNMLVGGRLFDRYVIIRRTNETGADLPPHEKDTGMKKITVRIEWTDPKGKRTYTVSTKIKDPQRKPPDSKFYGVVRTTYNTPIPNAHVVVEENPFYNDYTDENGNYTIYIPSGSWHLSVSSLLFFDVKTSTLVLKGGQEYECNFIMRKKATGIVRGDVYKRTHLVISEVCPAYTPSTQQGSSLPSNERTTLASIRNTPPTSHPSSPAAGNSLSNKRPERTTTVPVCTSCPCTPKPHSSPANVVVRPRPTLILAAARLWCDLSQLFKRMDSYNPFISRLYAEVIRDPIYYCPTCWGTSFCSLCYACISNSNPCYRCSSCPRCGNCHGRCGHCRRCNVCVGTARCSNSACNRCTHSACGGVRCIYCNIDVVITV